MAGVALPLRIIAPIAFAFRGAATEWVPTGQSFDEANRRDDDEINKREDDPSRNVRQPFRQGHPGFVRIDERAGNYYSEQHQLRAHRQTNLGDRMKLAAISPPAAKQQQHAADNQTELAFSPQGSRFASRRPHFSS